MTIEELQIQFDISSGNELEVLRQHVNKTSYGYIFVDSSNGQCHLFNKHGQLDDIRKIRHFECYVFYDCKSLKSMVIPDSVKSIGDNAFESCAYFENIIIPDSVESIGNYAFASCSSLKSINIPSFVKSIGNSAVWNCTSLESIVIPDSVKSIGKWAFERCASLENIIIPDSVESIRHGAFWDCKSLKEVIFKGKIIDQVKAMDYYPWRIKDINIIKCR